MIETWTTNAGIPQKLRNVPTCCVKSCKLLTYLLTKQQERVYASRLSIGVGISWIFSVSESEPENPAKAVVAEIY